MATPPSAPSPVESALFPKAPATLDKEDLKLVFEQYKIYVETMEKVVARRQVMHTFFLTASTALVTFSGLLLTKDFIGSPFSLMPVIGASTSGLLLSTLWWRLSAHYRRLSAKKFEVIHGYERYLPSAPFLAESKASGQGERAKTWQSMADLESIIALVFMALYVMMFAVALAAFVQRFQ